MMKKWFKTTIISGLIASIAAASGAFIACGDPEDPSTAGTQYTISVDDPETGGDITADLSKAGVGTTVTVTVTADEGYTLSYLKVNDVEVQVSDGKYIFTMPEGDVVITAEFAEYSGSGRVNLGTVTGGKLTADKKTAEEGEKVALTVTADYGYEINEVTLNGAAITPSEGGYSFDMPRGNANVSATFKRVAGVLTEARPTEKAFTVNSKALGGGAMATSAWTVVFKDDALAVDVYVTDTYIVEADEGIKLSFGRFGYEYIELSEVNKSITVKADGTVGYEVIVNGETVEPDEGFATKATVTPWGTTDTGVDGYKISVEVPYAALGASDKASALGNITMLPQLINKDRSTTLNVGTIAGGNALEPNTYPVLTADNAYKDNYFLYGSGQLGSGETVGKRGVWDLDEDYSVYDEARYPSRKAVLTGTQDDNDLIFYRESGKSIRAEATFRMDSILDSKERLGKFGLMLFDGGTQKGLFFYVDAASNGTTVDSVYGTQLGYVNGAGGYWSNWSTIPQSGGSFDKTKPITLSMTYDGDIVSMYVKKDGKDKLVEQAYYHSDGNVQLGIKSFKIGLTVTDYSVTTDKASEEFTSHNPLVVQEDVDVLFCGDSYMEFLRGYGVYETMVADFDSAANVGIGGTRYPDWSPAGKVKFLSMRYAPKNIVFHLGVNDIDSGTASNREFPNDVVVSNLKKLFAQYHQAFPEARIHWVSLIPNNLNLPEGVGGRNSDYAAVNAAIKAFCELAENSYLNYIDVATAFTAEDGGPRDNLLMDDGLHLNPVHGYPLWISIIKQSIGTETVTLTDGAKYGFIDDEKMPLGSGGGFEYDKTVGDTTYDVATKADYSSGCAEEAAWYKTDYATDFYYEVELRSADKFYKDDLSKVGIGLRNDDVTVFAYLECANDSKHADGANITYGSIVSRKKTALGCGNWDWNDQAGGSFSARNLKTGFVRIGVAKLGNTVYMLIDGEVIASKNNIPYVNASTKLIPGVMTFSRTVEVKNTVYSTDKNAGTLQYVIGLQKMDGVLATDDGDVWTQEILANHSDTYNINTTLITIYGVNTDRGVRIAVEVQHDRPIGEKCQDDANNPNGWHLWQGVEIRLNNLNDVLIQANARGHAANCVVAYNTVTNPEGSARTYTTVYELFVSHATIGTSVNEPVKIALGGVYGYGFSWIGGKLSYINEISATGVRALTEEIMPDGAFTNPAWTESAKNSTFQALANGALVTVKGVKTTNGVLVGVTVEHDVAPETSIRKYEGEHSLAGQPVSLSEWWATLGPEMRIGSKKMAVALSALGYPNNCFGNVISRENPAGSDYRYTTDFELFTSFANLGIAASEDPAFYLGGNYETGFDATIFTSSWDNQYVFVITADGMKHKNADSEATLDGKLTDEIWQKESVKNSAINMSNGSTNTKVMGFNGAKGITLAFIADHLEPVKTPLKPNGNDWSFFLNYEVRLAGMTDVLFQFGCSDGYQNKCVFAMNTSKNADGTYTTVYEAFIPHGTYNEKNQTVTLAAGQTYLIALGGVHSTHGFCWDVDWSRNVSISPDGLVFTGDSYKYALNGRMDDAVWTDEVKGKVYSDTINGRPTTVRGVKADGGVLLYIEVKSNLSVKQLTKQLQEGEDAGFWGFYQHLCVNLFAVGHYVVEISPIAQGFNFGLVGDPPNQTPIPNIDSRLGYRSIDNGEDAEWRYTTCYEIYFSYKEWPTVTDTSGKVALSLFGNIDAFARRGCGQGDKDGDINWFFINCYITDTGVELVA